MDIFQKILHKLNGMHYTQEYLCLPQEKHTYPLHAFITSENKVIKDITTQCLMVGICPLIFALPSLEEFDLSNHDKLQISYSVSKIEKGSPPVKRNIVAELLLKKIKEQKIASSLIYYFEGVHGKHRFLSPGHRFINQFNNSLYNKNRDIFLKKKLYTQIQIAYSIPQTISLITVGSKDLYNLFPTDQHGQLLPEYYIITLRHAGNASRQVEAAKKIVLSNINVSYHKQVYGLGKNHMQPLKQKSSFSFSEMQSKILQLPLPLHALEYRELELQNSFVHGIHKVSLFKILSHQKINDSPATLACINNAYATWRYKNKLPNNHLIGS